MPREIITFENVSFTYPTRKGPSLSNVSFVIHEGDFVLVTGSTGCGKTTLLKMLNGIIPHLSKGTPGGRAVIAGLDAKHAGMEALTKEVGLIFQNPNDQIVSNSVEEEIAFGLENLGLSDAEIRERITWACEQVSISDLRERDPNSLSGGQKQRVVIASQVAMRPRILAFDEPLSSLDPRCAGEVTQCIARLNRRGITIVMVEHRIGFVAPYCSHVLVLDQGALVEFAPRDESFMHPRDVFGAHGLEIPPEVHICRHTGGRKLTFDEAELADHVRRWHTAVSPEEKSFYNPPDTVRAVSGEVTVRIENVTFGYAKSRTVLNECSLTVHRGETIALMGANGTGKSTLLSLIAGLIRPDKGEIIVNGIETGSLGAKKRASLLGFLIQNPDLMLFCDTVREELAFGPRHVRRTRADIDGAIAAILAFLNLSPQQNLPPFTLSMGQRLRAALGAVLSLQPRILLLDEPTTGQNKENIRRLMETLAQLEHIDTIIFCTHDFETAIEHADRIAVLHGGRVAADCAPAEIFEHPELLRNAGLQMPLTTRLAHSLGLPAPLRLPHEFSKALQTRSAFHPAGA